MTNEGSKNHLPQKYTDELSIDSNASASNKTGAFCGKTENLRILEQFQKVYVERMKRLEGDKELEIHTLKSWVHDLTEQNTLLVHTVEELERELLKRVDVMQDQLQKTNVAVRRKELCSKTEPNAVERKLRHQIQLLQNDITSLLDVIDQARKQGRWTIDDLKLHSISRDKAFRLIDRTKPFALEENRDFKSSVKPKCLSKFSEFNDIFSEFREEKQSKNVLPLVNNIDMKSTEIFKPRVKSEENILKTVEESDNNIHRKDPIESTPQVLTTYSRENDYCRSPRDFSTHLNARSPPSFENSIRKNQNCKDLFSLKSSNRIDPNKEDLRNVPSSSEFGEEKFAFMSGKKNTIEKTVSDFNSKYCDASRKTGSSVHKPDNFIASSEYSKTGSKSLHSSTRCEVNNSAQVIFCLDKRQNEQIQNSNISVSADPIDSLAAGSSSQTHTTCGIGTNFDQKIKQESHASNSTDGRSLQSPNPIHLPSPKEPQNSYLYPYLPEYYSEHVLAYKKSFLTADPCVQSPVVAEDSQNDLKGAVVGLKTELAYREAEILDYLERIEEMQKVLRDSSQQVRLVVENKQKFLQQMAGDQSNANQGDSQPSTIPHDTKWVLERMQHQQEQVTHLTSRLYETEANLGIVQAERDRLLQELEKMQMEKPVCCQTHTQTQQDPSLVVLNEELETTRLQLGEALRKVQSLSTVMQNAEQASRETQAALTLEVAEKHDQMLALRREVQQLEEQVHQAYMQTHFKDNIIHEMRKELRIARSKNSAENTVDSENSKQKRVAFPPIPECGNVTDSGLDDGDNSVSSRSSTSQSEVESLRSLLHNQQQQIIEKDQKLANQREKLLAIEKKLAAQNEPKESKTIHSLTLKDLEEYRLCTVEAQASVEELREELEYIINDLKDQESRMEDLNSTAQSSEEILRSVETTLAQALQSTSCQVETSGKNQLMESLTDVKVCVEKIHSKTEEFIRERKNAEQQRTHRERKMSKLQEQLDNSHDNMRDGIVAMEQALAERYDADRLSQRDSSDGSSFHSCREADSQGCLKQVERLEERNAELLSNLSTTESIKRDLEDKVKYYTDELERFKQQLEERIFNEDMLRTKEQLICELKGTLESTRRQMVDLHQELERTAKEKDSLKTMYEQSASCTPVQVADLQSELAQVRHQLSYWSGKQVLIQQYERRIQENSDQMEKLNAEIRALTLNLQAKEKMLSNKEETITILQDTVNRIREEMRVLKEKSATSSAKLSGTDRPEGANGSVTMADDVSATRSRDRLVRELTLDLNEMLAQYRDCFTEMTRQTKWHQDLREAYLDLRAQAEHMKQEALQIVSASQKEMETLKGRIQIQNSQITQLKEQIWSVEQLRRRAEEEVEQVRALLAQRRIFETAQLQELATAEQGRRRACEEVTLLREQLARVSQTKQSTDRSSVQIKESQTSNNTEEELRQLRDFRDKCERAARSLADIEDQDKDPWSGFNWDDSSESEDSQKREARLQATLGLLLVEAAKRRQGSQPWDKGPYHQEKDSSDSESENDRGTNHLGTTPKVPPHQLFNNEEVGAVPKSHCAFKEQLQEGLDKRQRHKLAEKRRKAHNKILQRCETCRSLAKSCPQESLVCFASCDCAVKPLVPKIVRPTVRDDSLSSDICQSCSSQCNGAVQNVAPDTDDLAEIFVHQAPELNTPNRSDLEIEVGHLRDEVTKLRGVEGQYHQLTREMDTLRRELQRSRQELHRREGDGERRQTSRPSDVQEMNEAAQAVLRESEQRRIRRLQGQLQIKEEAMRSMQSQVKGLRAALILTSHSSRYTNVGHTPKLLRFLFGFEAEAQIRKHQLREIKLFMMKMCIDGYPRRLTDQTGEEVDVPTTSVQIAQEQLLDTLEENRQLRGQIRVLQSENEQLVSQMQSVHDVGSASLTSIRDNRFPEQNVVVSAASRTSASARTLSLSAVTKELADQVDNLSADKQALVEQNRALRSALSRASSTASSGWRGTASDHTDHCDSGFWSIQASPPWSPPRVCASPAVAPAARACWPSAASASASVSASFRGLSPPPTSLLPPVPSMSAPNSCGTFIVNSRRPKGFRN